MALKHLLSPLEIGPMRIGNRVVMAPMGTGYADDQHRVTDQLVAYLEARAQGKVGLIITEHTAVAPSGLTGPRMLGIFSDDHVEGFARLAEAVHRSGVRLAVQLQHGGRQARPEVSGVCLAPSPVPAGRDRRVPRELSVEEIHEIVDAFAEAAARAQMAGCDGVEIHMAHGYLGASFLSPFLNRRRDDYGGDTRRRCRFAFEVIEAIRERCGDELAVWARVSGDEFICGGMNVDEIRRVAPLLQEAGYQAIHVSACMGETSQYASAPPLRPQGHLIYLAEAVKREVDVPVIGVGNITDPEYADALIRDGRVDAVAVGRALLSDARWLEKARRGQAERIIPCLQCNLGCLGREVPPEGTVQCAVNPLTGREATWEKWPGGPKVAESKLVVVVGGGPAGVTFALTAAARGYEVHLYEETDTIGGCMRLAAKVRGLEAFGRYADWLARELKESRVVVRFGEVVTYDDYYFRFEDAEAVVVATGLSRWVLPKPIDFMLMDAEDPPRVVGVFDALQEEQEVGRAAIIGATHVGLYAALALADRGWRITILPDGHEPGHFMSAAMLYFLRHELQSAGVQWLEGWALRRFVPGGIELYCRTTTRELELDMVITAAPLRASQADLPRVAVEEGVQQLFAVGCARKVRNLHWSVYEAAEMARRL